MRITEVTAPSERTLFEQIEAENDTGISTEDLVRIVRQERDGTWSEPMSADELIEHLRRLLHGG